MRYEQLHYIRVIAIATDLDVDHLRWEYRPPDQLSSHFESDSPKTLELQQNFSTNFALHYVTLRRLASFGTITTSEFVRLPN
jgi:hypothetical protein